MKKLIILFAIMLSLVGCANGDDSNNTNTEAEVPKTDNDTPLVAEASEEPEELDEPPQPTSAKDIVRAASKTANIFLDFFINFPPKRFYAFTLLCVKVFLQIVLYNISY